MEIHLSNTHISDADVKLLFNIKYEKQFDTWCTKASMFDIFLNEYSFPNNGTYPPYEK